MAFRRPRLLAAAAFVAAATLGIGMAQAMDISGAGATFPYPVFAKWAADYANNTGNHMNYQSIGSGGGIAQIKAGTVDFGASDKPLTPKELAAAGLGQFPDVIGGILSGSSIATWCLSEPAPGDALGAVSLDARVEGDMVVLNGVKRPVESGARADYLLVTGRTGSGLTQVLVPAGAPGSGWPGI